MAYKRRRSIGITVVDSEAFRVVARPLSVLCDLRPAFEGHYGIPHETRLSFRLLHDLDGINVTGLLNHPTRMLTRTVPIHGHAAGDTSRLYAYSRLAASTCPPYGRLERMQHHVAGALKFAWLQVLAKSGLPISLDHFDASEFGDFLWHSLFAPSLPPADFEMCRNTSYAALWAHWRALHSTALIAWPRRYAKVDTSGYDAFIAQTPWPGIVAPNTQMIVRYHDAFPIFLPHTTKQSRLHQRLHFSALNENALSAIFACVSDFSRNQLLRIRPELEQRAKVVFNSISDEYYPETPMREMAVKIISSRIDASTEPDLGQPNMRQAFYDRHLHRDDFRYLLVVSTLEPRKNHQGLLAVRDILNRKHQQPIAMVFVGSTGWSDTEILRTLRINQMRGAAFHLTSVPASEMRVLYSSAEAVLCPSFSEGFDLPSVEAIRCGAAVAASDIATHREMLGDAAHYFDPYSTTSMSNALTRILTIPDVPSELRSKAKSRATRFDKSVVQEQWRTVLSSVRKPPRG